MKTQMMFLVVAVSFLAMINSAEAAGPSATRPTTAKKPAVPAVAKKEAPVSNAKCYSREEFAEAKIELPAELHIPFSLKTHSVDPKMKLPDIGFGMSADWKFEILMEGKPFTGLGEIKTTKICIDGEKIEFKTDNERLPMVDASVKDGIVSMSAIGNKMTLKRVEPGGTVTPPASDSGNALGKPGHS